MERAQPLRGKLRAAYAFLLREGFGQERLAAAEPAAERYAMAQPGGAPWRRNLIPRPDPLLGEAGA